MAETFAEREKKRPPSLLPKITRTETVHMPLASMANAARYVRVQSEQTQVGKDAVPVADFNMRVAGNLSKLRTDPAGLSGRFAAMLERLS